MLHRSIISIVSVGGWINLYCDSTKDPPRNLGSNTPPTICNDENHFKLEVVWSYSSSFSCLIFILREQWILTMYTISTKGKIPAEVPVVARHSRLVHHPTLGLLFAATIMAFRSHHDSGGGRRRRCPITTTTTNTARAKRRISRWHHPRRRRHWWCEERGQAPGQCRMRGPSKC